MLYEGLCPYDLRDEDYDTLSYLEEWERTQPAERKTNVHQQMSVIAESSIIAATKEEFQDEVREIIQTGEGAADAKTDEPSVKKVYDILDQMAAESTRPHLPKVRWNYVPQHKLPIYYYERCAQMGRILEPADINSDEFLPSWRFFKVRHYIDFDYLVWVATGEARLAGCTRFLKLAQDYKDACFARQIINERQNDIDETVQRETCRMTAEAKTKRAHEAVQVERHERVAVQDAAYAAAQAQLQEKLQAIPVVKTYGINSRGERVCPSEESPASGTVDVGFSGLLGSLRKAASELLEDFLNLLLT